MLKAIGLILIASVCVLCNLFTPSYGDTILDKVTQGVFGLAQKTVEGQTKALIELNKLLPEGVQHKEQEAWAKWLDTLYRAKNLLGDKATALDESIITELNKKHLGDKQAWLTLELDLALQALKYYYKRQLPVPSAVNYRILSLATQLEDDTRESVVRKNAQFLTLSYRLDRALTTSADPTSDTDAVITATDEIASDVRQALTAGAPQLAELKQELTVLARNGSQPALELATGLKQVADRTAGTVLTYVKAMRQQLVANEQAVQKALSAAPVGDLKDHLIRVDQRLVKQIADYDKLVSGVAALLAPDGQSQ